MDQSPEVAFSNLNISHHAAQRQRERRIDDAALDYVLLYGTHLHCAGATFVFLRERDVPTADRRTSHLARLAGTVVVMGDESQIVTVYRNTNALRDIRRKRKYDNRKRRQFQRVV